MKRGATSIALLVAVACNGEFRFDDERGGDASVDAPHGCTDDADCPLASLHCDPGSGVCYPCTTDTQCPPSSASCDPTLHRCVECESTRDCPTGQICETTTRRCLPGCRESLNCAPPAIGCDELRGICATCQINDDCRASPDGARCDRTIERCVECIADTHCTSGHCDRTRGKCVACLASSDCADPTPLCDPTSWTCVAHP